VMAAIGQITDAPLAHALESLANEFQFNRMLQLLQGDERKEAM
jgi:hypothetical protein